MFTNATNKFWGLVINSSADVDGFKICIQVCVWLGFPPLEQLELEKSLNTPRNQADPPRQADPLPPGPGRPPWIRH